MKAWMLPFRRLWWFVSDHTTEIRFNWECAHCGEQIVMESTGFRPPRWVSHNALCGAGRSIRCSNAIRDLRGWLHCRYCRRLNLINYKMWLICRWNFRLKYNWGVGVPEECLRNEHDFGNEPEASYEEGNTLYLIGLCRRCGFRNRFWTKA